MRDGTIPHGPACLADERLPWSSPTSGSRSAEADAGGVRPGAARRRQRPRLPGPRRQRRALPARRSWSRSRRLLRPGGALVIWSAAESPDAAEGDGARCSATADPGRATTSRLQGRRRAVLALPRPRRPRESAVPTARLGSLGSMDGYRTEHDSMGEVQVPADALWRAQTQRAVENFPISGSPLEPEHVHALAQVKAAAAKVNAELGVIDDGAGRGDPRRPPPRSPPASTTTTSRSTSSRPAPGTSSNMNMNEVLATLAGRAGVEVHPNDHVNASQSSNDTFPTSIHVAATSADHRPAGPGAATTSRRRSRRKAEEFADVVKAGRTHLMDATPVTLGQEFGGYAAAVRLRRRAARGDAAPGAPSCRSAAPRSAPASTPRPGSRRGVIEELADVDRPAVHRGPRPLRGAGRARRAGRALAAQLRTIAVGLTKICNDLRWMASGPRTGLAEIHLPDLQPGLEHHARQGQPGAARGDADGLRAGDRQRRRPWPWPARPATSSST